jgi:hypothetical protein
MIKQLSEDKVLVFEPANFSTASSVISGKKLKGAVFIYDMAANDEDVETIYHEELQEKLAYCFDHNPDGMLVWVPINLQDKFITFIGEFIVDQYHGGNLNFDNGSIAEAFGFHYYKEGILVEMIDPECGTSVFYEALGEFSKQENIEDDSEELNLNEFFFYEGYHLNSALNERDEENYKFYDIIQSLKNDEK